MPRGLGDDPLSRRRKRKGSTEAPPAAQETATLAQQTSHNDVFFMRRSEGPREAPANTPEQRGDAGTVKDRPEIGEVTDIVRIAEVAQSGQSEEEVVEPTVGAESPRLKPSGPVMGGPTMTSSQTSDSSEVQSEPQKKRGFFKRLFGRQGK